MTDSNVKVESTLPGRPLYPQGVVSLTGERGDSANLPIKNDSSLGSVQMSQVSNASGESMLFNALFAFLASLACLNVRIAVRFLTL